MGFSNSIIGGASKLVRPAIQSPNYQAGVAGWSINRDGSAEFVGLVLRTGTTGRYIVIGANGGNEIDFYSGVTGETAPAHIRVDVTGGPPATDGLLELAAPSIAGGTPAKVTLESSTSTSTIALESPGVVSILPATTCEISAGGSVQVAGLSGITLDPQSGACRVVGPFQVDSASTLGVHGQTTTTGGDMTVTGNLTVGGVGQRQTVRSTTDQTVTGIILTNSTAITFPVLAGCTYVVRAVVFYTAGASSNLNLAWATPAGTVGKRGTFGPDISSLAGNVIAVTDQVSGAPGTRFVFGGSGGTFRQVREELLLVIANSGNVTLQFCENSAGSGATLLAYSYATVERIV